MVMSRLFVGNWGNCDGAKIPMEFGGEMVDSDGGME